MADKISDQWSPAYMSTSTEIAKLSPLGNCKEIRRQARIRPVRRRHKAPRMVHTEAGWHANQLNSFNIVAVFQPTRLQNVAQRKNNEHK